MAGISDFNVAFARNRAQTALDGWLTGHPSIEISRWDLNFRVEPIVRNPPAGSDLRGWILRDGSRC